MLYKEALQSHTIEEQSRELGELSSRLAAAQAAGWGAAAGEREAAAEQLRAVADSRARDVAKILDLDEQLGV